MTPQHKSALLWTIKIVLFVAFIALVVWVNQYAIANDGVRVLATKLGYPGMFLAAAISGFNLLIPIPVISFYPFFLSAGFHPVLTVVVIAIGMSLGDTIGYIIGKAGRGADVKPVKHLITLLERVHHKHRYLPYVAMFLYAAFVPLPNELLVIPLALMGMRLVPILVVVALGNIVFNTLAALGFVHIF